MRASCANYIVMSKIYAIRYTDGTTDSTIYETRGDAAEAIRQQMAWDDIAFSEGFTTDTDEPGIYGTGYECYATQEDCDAHPDGDVFAPRIVAMVTS